MTNIGNESPGDIGGVLKTLREGRVKGPFLSNLDWSTSYSWSLTDSML
jgi:hypothetical protein